MSNEKDPFAFEDDDGDDQKEAEELRKERNRLGKLVRDGIKEIERLKPFEVQITSQQREGALSKVFEAAGVNPKHTKFFTALNPEADAAAVTKEQVLAFATDNELPVVAPKVEDEAEKETEGEKQGFTPAGGGPTAAPTGILNREDWLKLSGIDPKAAEAAFRAGKVDLSEIYEGLGPDK